MADQLPLNIAIPPEPTLATYSYTDIADGTGVIKLYGYQSSSNTGMDYHLTSQTPYSASMSIITPNNTIATYDFDLSPFNTPRTVKGNALFQIGAFKAAAASGAIFVEIQKFDGVTPTTIASKLSEIFLSSGSNGGKNFVVSIPVPQTHFKIGENLRLSLTIHSRGSNMNVGTDPKNIEFSELVVGVDIEGEEPTGQLILNVPFKLNL